MKDDNKTKAQLINEVVELRQRVTELETLKTACQRAEAATQQCHQELLLLNRVGQVCNSTLQLEQVLNIVLEEIRRLLNASICSLWLIDPETNELVCRRATGFRQDLVEGWRLGPGQGLVGWTARTGKSLIVPDTRTDTRHYKDIDERIGLELRSIISVPLQVKEHVIGAINVTDIDVDHFRSTDLKLLESLAAMAAITIQNNRLGEQAQQAFSERQASAEMWRRYEFIVNASQDFMTLIGKDHKYEAVNEAYCQAHQKNRAEIIGRSVVEVWGEAQYSSEIKRHLEHCFTGKEAHRQGWFEFATLGRRYFDVIYYPYCNQEGTVTHAVVISRDFTEAKQLEEQLRQVQKMEAIGQLAGGIAHDFNNLLTVMMGHTDLALEILPADSLIRSDILGIQKTAQRAADLTRQLLAFARKQIIEPRVLNLNELIDDMDKMLRRLIREDIQLLTLTGPELGRVEVDPNQIEQVLINLVVNACDAMPKGGTVTIETTNITLTHQYAGHYAEMISGDYVLLTVSDTGIGMTEEVKAHLFEPFFTTKEVGKGTGLGLATVYGIIKQSNGHIWVYSAPGQGTTFKIYLPCAASAPKWVKNDMPLLELEL